MNYKQSITGGAIAFIIATACCWLPALLIIAGGSAGLIGLSESMYAYSGVFFAAGIILVAFGVYKYLKKKNTSSKTTEVILESTLTCPLCRHQKKETMPIDACQYFYECSNCLETLKPKEGDCCVFCSYGTIPCPPIQEDKNCC